MLLVETRVYNKKELKKKKAKMDWNFISIYNVNEDISNRTYRPAAASFFFFFSVRLVLYCLSHYSEFFGFFSFPKPFTRNSYTYWFI